MRLRSEIWVKAYIRRCASAGVMAVVARHGDDDAGAIFIRINRLDGTSVLYGPAPAGLDSGALDREWVMRPAARGASGPGPDAAIDAVLAREVDFDTDLWIIEVEDRAGRHFLDGWLSVEGRR